MWASRSSTSQSQVEAGEMEKVVNTRNDHGRLSRSTCSMPETLLDALETFSLSFPTKLQGR